MKFAKVLDRTVSSLSNLAFVIRNPKLGKLDLAVLQVALMIAALDGKVQRIETESFLALAMKCRGSSAKAVRTAYENALRAAGYISILVQVEDEDKVLDAFVDEVVKAMPDSFLMAHPEDVRRAFVIWTAMAMSDGEYSGIERKAVQALVKRFVVIKTKIFQDKIDRAMAMSPAFRAAYGSPAPNKAEIRLLPDGFLDEVEKKLAKAKEGDIEELIKA